MDDYLSKPVSGPVMIEMVERLGAQRRGDEVQICQETVAAT
jgi:hypothetical protein